jgi:hypothetical protein
MAQGSQGPYAERSSDMKCVVCHVLRLRLSQEVFTVSGRKRDDLSGRCFVISLTEMMNVVVLLKALERAVAATSVRARIVF